MEKIADVAIGGEEGEGVGSGDEGEGLQTSLGAEEPRKVKEVERIKQLQVRLNQDPMGPM